MKQIYEFDEVSPPVLNESMLRAEMEKRKIRRQTALLAVAGILLQIVVTMLGFLALTSNLLIAVFCFVYVLVSVTGSSVIAVVFTQKEKGGLSV